MTYFSIQFIAMSEFVAWTWWEATHYHYLFPTTQLRGICKSPRSVTFLVVKYNNQVLTLSQFAH